MLTNLSAYKEHAGITGTADDQAIKNLIDRVCDAIQTHCRRTFTATTYRIWLDGPGAQSLNLPNWPILNLYGVSVGTDDVLRVSHTSAEFATVSVSGTGVDLFSVDTSGTETEATDLFSANKTIGDLATAITANGFSVETLSGQSTRPANTLRPARALYAVDPDTADLCVAGDYEDARITYETDRTIERVRGFTFPRGKANVFVWYKAGYTPATPQGLGTIPAGLTLIANQIVNSTWRNRKTNPALSSERLADHAVGYAQTNTGSGVVNAIHDAIGAYSSALTPYRRIDITV